MRSDRRPARRVTTPTGVLSGALPGVVALAAIIVAGCATPPPQPATRQETLVVVVPERDGKVGSVAVSTPQGTAVINTPYAAVRTSPGGPQPSMLSEAEIRQRFGAALDARPDIPMSFTLNFLEGRDELTPPSVLLLPGILAELRRRGNAEVTVIGHTDRVGRLEYNDRLSLQRAQRVVSELVRIGIPATAVVAAGRGEREPLVPTDDEVAEPRNRRVEVNIR